jgi:glycosyltransferase involved in cell wall biosynthesis
MPAVSVLMPCYNTALTLDEALTSLADQTLEPVMNFDPEMVDSGHGTKSLSE